VLVFALALAFQGTRGIWDPDEGYYTNAALGMLSSGDWVVPQLNGQPFLDKPPLLLWTIAVALRVGPHDEWSARAPQAMWLALTALLVGLLAARWWGRGAGTLACAIYALSAGPFLAANVLTPDTPLAFAVVCAAYACWRLEESTRAGQRLAWGALAGLATALGGLAKGPAMLVFVAPLLAWAALQRSSVRHTLELPYWIWAALAVAVVAPWYFAVALRVPGGASYMFDSQIAGRLYTAEYARNSGAFEGFMVYLPTLIIGSLPWSAVWAIGLATWRHRSWRVVRPRRPEALLLTLWIVLPLAVLIAARSRLPLYVLPLFAPLALATTRLLAARLEASSRATRLAWIAAALAWGALLVAIKLAVAQLPNRHDARLLAAELSARGVRHDQALIVVDGPHNGLAFYGFRHLEQVRTAERPYPFYATAEHVSTEVDEIAEGEPESHVVVHGSKVAVVVGHLERRGIASTADTLATGHALLRLNRQR
jgi:4-amino-4-deoxy-L-arabinose transferase-like glycosyltransferase